MERLLVIDRRHIILSDSRDGKDALDEEGACDTHGNRHWKLCDNRDNQFRRIWRRIICPRLKPFHFSSQHVILIDHIGALRFSADGVSRLPALTRVPVVDLETDGRGCTIVMLNQNALSRPIVQFDE